MKAARVNADRTTVASAPKTRNGDPAIVIIEDDPDIAKLLPVMLSDTGAEFVVVQTEFERCVNPTWWQNLGTVRGAIIDYRLPGDQDGFAIAVVARGSLDATVPVILYTAEQSAIPLSEVPHGVRVIEKPGTPRQLRAALQLPERRISDP